MNGPNCAIIYPLSPFVYIHLPLFFQTYKCLPDSYPCQKPVCLLIAEVSVRFQGDRSGPRRKL